MKGSLGIPGAAGRPDWSAVRDTLDLAAVATRLLGPAPGRRGVRGRRLWWSCPFHEEDNPSFAIVPGQSWYRCFGCNARGDAVDLVRKLNPGMTFPEAVALLDGPPARWGPAPPRPARRAAPEALPGAWRESAAALVADAERRLWTPSGAEALRYLQGGRGLAEETIRQARLGSAPGRGITIPWFDRIGPTLVNVRRPPGSSPKYMAIRGGRRGGLYPGPGAIRPGLPGVVVEGEFDALLLGQELGELAGVVTLGSASGGPSPEVLAALLGAAPWFVATDADQAGDKAAARWPARARRVRPPAPFKDWTEARQGGVDLRRWWGEILSGNDRPQIFTWSDLSRMRWGPALGGRTEQGIDRR
jgi:hypothetical protein